MKKMFLFASVMIIALGIGGNALAQLDPDDDGIGVYFDPSAAGSNCVFLEPGTYRSFVVITHPTAQRAGVGGWEAKIWLTGPAIITNTTYEGNSLNFLSPPEYLVGIQIPLYNPYMYPAVVVAYFDYVLLDDTEPVYWWIDAIFRSSLPEKVPAYLDGDDYNIIIPLQQPTGGPDIPVASINGECAVPADDVSWGEMKTLFR
jgi:hypothetical protein